MVADQIKPLALMLPSHVGTGLSSRCSISWEKQQKVAQGPATHMGNPKEAPEFRLAQSWLLWHSGSEPSHPAPPSLSL